MNPTRRQSAAWLDLVALTLMIPQTFVQSTALTPA
jgi:hypothetical protein